MCQLSILRTDRTRRSTWPDASGRWQQSNLKRTALSDRTRPVVQEPYCTLTGRSVESDRWWPDAFGQRSTLLELDRTYCRRVRSFSQSCPIRSLTLSDSGQPNHRVWSRGGPRSIDRVEAQWLPRPRPVKDKWLKRLRIATQLEPSFFQLNFGLHLSYLVLSLTSVHHT
jgi:hypothetical protein